MSIAEAGRALGQPLPIDQGLLREIRAVAFNRIQFYSRFMESSGTWDGAPDDEDERYEIACQIRAGKAPRFGITETYRSHPDEVASNPLASVDIEKYLSPVQGEELAAAYCDDIAEAAKLLYSRHRLPTDELLDAWEEAISSKNRGLRRIIGVYQSVADRVESQLNAPSPPRKARAKKASRSNPARDAEIYAAVEAGESRQSIASRMGLGDVSSVAHALKRHRQQSENSKRG